MKKHLLTLCVVLIAAIGAQGDDYTVYTRGMLHPGLVAYGWWNADFNFTAPDPSQSTEGEEIGQVFEFKASDVNGYSDASMGLNLEQRFNTGSLSDATLTFSWYAVGTGTYSIRLTCVSEEDYTFQVKEENLGHWNFMSLPVKEFFPKVSEEWYYNLKNGVGYIFSVILTNGKEGDAIYFDNIIYTDIDLSWEAPEYVVEKPKTVPVPTQAAEDVVSIFSTAYTSATSFTIGFWGQSTNVTDETIDGNKIEYLRNFDYLGWEFPALDVNDCQYMHVDYWTPEGGTPFGFVPISLDPTKDTPIWSAPEVKAKEWNSYDVALSTFNADMMNLRQIKFVANQAGGKTGEAYIANVYFWKEGNGEDPGTGDNQGGNGNVFAGQEKGTYTQTMSAENVKDYNYTLQYDIQYNEDKTLTLNGKFDWEDGVAPVGATDDYNVLVPGVWVLEGNKQGESYTTTQKYDADETVTITFQTAVALGNVEVKVEYVVGSANENPGGDTSGVSTAIDKNIHDIYTLSGIQVGKSMSIEDAKTILSPGLYIIGGKKVIIK